MSAELFVLLGKALSPVNADRDLAEKSLQALRAQNLPAFLLSLCAELANDQRDPSVRSLAGLILKNSLDAKNEVERLALAQSWVNLPQHTRDQIKLGVLQTLNSPVEEARHTAASVVAKIGKIEIPVGLWPNLVQTLLAASMAPAPEIRQAALETLGYLCEQVEGDSLQERSNEILTAVVSAMRKEETHVNVRKAGVDAFFNALSFAYNNFDRQDERDYIMTVVCEGTQAAQKELRFLFWECLVKIADLYYDKLPAYMNQLLMLTLEAIRNDPEEDIKKQGIEFWSTISDVEMQILEAIEEGEEQPGSCFQFVRGALKFIVPPLLEALTKQTEDVSEEDEFTLPVAAGTCLALIAQTVTDDIIDQVLPFVQQNIMNPDWHFREAATLAFGSILQGPITDRLEEITAEALGVLLPHMKDPSPSVKDTTAWTLGRICQCQPGAVRQEVLPQLIAVLTQGLLEEPRVAANVCWSLHNLARAYEEEAVAPTGRMSPHFNNLLMALLEVSERRDGDEFRFRASAYEAMNSLIQMSALDLIPTIEQLVPVFMDRLARTFQMPVLSSDDKNRQREMQSLNCSSLQVLAQKLGRRVTPHADKIMYLLLEVFASRSAALEEEALMAIGALANACEVDFARYLPHFREHLANCLRNWEEAQVCAAAVGIVGDIARAVGDRIVPYCDEIIALLLGNLQNQLLQRDVQPLIISTFGDLAMAISGNFERYLLAVMGTLSAAAATEVDKNNLDMADFLDSLRESILEAFTGICQGMRTDGKADVLEPYLPVMLGLIQKVFAESPTGSPLRRTALGTLGDVFHAVGVKAKPFVTADWVKAVMARALKDPNKQTRDIALWVKSIMDAIVRT